MDDIQKIEFSGNVDSRRHDVRRAVQETYGPELGIDESGILKSLLEKCLFLLSYTEDATLADVIDLLEDGTFYDEVEECVPDCNLKRNFSYDISAIPDGFAHQLEEAIENYSGMIN